MGWDAWVLGRAGLGCSEPWNSSVGSSAQLPIVILKTSEPGAFPHKQLKFLGKTEGEEVGRGHNSDQSKPGTAAMARDQDNGNGRTSRSR